MSALYCCKPTINFNAFHWTVGSVKAGSLNIPRISTILTFADKIGDIGVRWAIGRDRYMIPPGLYAIGDPNTKSNVIVTSNYKLTFDHVRKALREMNIWLLILDTQGINVWCAAGKGTFGTDELIKRINETKLSEIIEHKKIILPQLGASGVCARKVATETGLKIIFGPVRISDIKAFIGNNMTANPEMRRVNFNLLDRAILVPVELVLAGKYIIASIFLIMAIASLISLRLSPDAIHIGIRGAIALLAGWLTGSIASPLALPILPGRSFSLKGGFAGALSSCLLWFLMKNTASPLELTAWTCLIISISSFITMNFTGTSTYTSPSGVRKEMKMFVPIQLVACLTGIVCMIVTFIKTF